VIPVVHALDRYYQKMQREGRFEPVSCSACTSSTGYIDSYAHSLLDDSLELFDQAYNAPDPQGVNHWDTKRDLTKVWNARKVRRLGFDQVSTWGLWQRRWRNTEALGSSGMLGVWLRAASEGLGGGLGADAVEGGDCLRATH
jgi:hypothetical protein